MTSISRQPKGAFACSKTGRWAASHRRGISSCRDRENIQYQGLQASERCFRKTLHQLLSLNNHYGNKEMPFSEAYICFFINPIYSILIPCLFKFRSGYANYSDYFFANQEYVFCVLVGGDYFFTPYD